MNIKDLEKMYKLDKNGKIVKKTDESDGVKRQKLNFGDLKVPKKV
jgi:hypothetical protein